MYEENCIYCFKFLIVVFIGFYGVSFVDGFEYCGYYGLMEDELISFYCFWMKVFIEFGVDFLVCEIILCLLEVKVIIKLLEEFFGIYVWISFSVKDGWYISEGMFIFECVVLFDFCS